MSECRKCFSGAVSERSQCRIVAVARVSVSECRRESTQKRKKRRGEFVNCHYKTETNRDLIYNDRGRGEIKKRGKVSERKGIEPGSTRYETDGE